MTASAAHAASPARRGKWGERIWLILAAGVLLPVLAVTLTATVFHYATKAGAGWLTILALPAWGSGYWFLSRRFARTYPVRYEGSRAQGLFKLMTSLATVALVLILTVVALLVIPDAPASLVWPR